MCLENGLVGQGITQDSAVTKLKEAIDSFQEVYRSEERIYTLPISIKELHEFLVMETKEPIDDVFKLRAVYA